MKPRLVVATGNPGKVEEFREGLAELDIDLVSAAELGLTRFPPETGSSYEENAFVKAAWAAMQTGLPALADDSGLEVQALGGAPGIYSARFGGELSPGERNAHLLSKLRDVPRGARGAFFVCTVVIATPAGEVKAFDGEVHGEILEGPRGRGGFGYDPVFYSPELGKTFAEASADEKRSVSHRGRALGAFLDWALTPSAQRTLVETVPPPPKD